jgi:hypothetical protein
MIGAGAMYNIQSVNNSHVKYRLGDAVLLRNGAAYPARGVVNKMYEGTIGYEYITTNESKGDIKHMNRLIDEHIERHGYKVPDDDEVVVHLRIGDNGEVKRPRDKLVKNDKEFEKLIELIKDACDGFSDKVTVVTAMHAVDGPQNEHYKIVERLCDRLPVTIKSSPNIDEDFCYLARAKKLIVTKGNFSDLAGRCNPNYVVRLDGRDPLNRNA